MMSSDISENESAAMADEDEAMLLLVEEDDSAIGTTIKKKIEAFFRNRMGKIEAFSERASWIKKKERSWLKIRV